MSEGWGAKSHIRIPRDRIRHSQKKPRLPPMERKEKKDTKKSGRTLIKQLDQSVEYCRRPQKIIDEDVFIIIRTESSLTYQEKALNRFSLRLSLQLDEYSAIVSLDKETLDNFRTSLMRYGESAKLRSYLDRIESISRVDFNRISPELSEWLTSSKKPAYIEIEMLPNLEEEQYTSLIGRLTKFLKQESAKIFNSRIRKDSASIRGFLKPQTVKMITQGVDSVWQARQAPEIIIGSPESLPIEEHPIPRPPDSDAKNVCVLDTGIDMNHPFLKGVYSTSVDLTPDRSPQDFHGHGTFICGLAAYGELENRPSPKASARIISVKILGRQPSRVYLENLLEQAVDQFYTQTKIFSLSVMYSCCSSVSQPTNLAYTIDKLCHDYDVMFVICTGNISDELPSLIGSLPYPEYLGDSCCTIYSGAEACNAVTVGGVANKDSDNSIARRKQPSPFTRRGELRKRGKPDVVSWAGNVELPAASSGSFRFHVRPELSVISLALSPSTLGYDIGTSYAAPIVANILARLSKEYPNAGINLLKALVIHFSYWPDEHRRINASEDLKKALYGKGISDFDRCAYSTNSCATYIMEDSVGYNEIAWIPIYVPAHMRDIYGEKRMRVTLVYNPPVDRGVLGYTLVDLDFQLYKQLRIQRKWDRVYRQRWDNVKTDVFRWQKMGWGKEWTLMVFPRLRFRERIADSNDNQKFAVVVSLEDPSKKINIYDAIIQETKMKTIPIEAYLQTATVPA